MRLLLASFFLLAATLALPDAARAERRVALVVGNGAYETIQALRNPANDAASMAAALEELGFEVTLQTDADRRTMARLILDFGRTLAQAGPDAVGLFFYAGHGVQADGTNYLLPLGSRIDTEADLEIEAVDANWVLGQMHEAGNGLNLVILDACRNNPYEGSFRSATRGLARLDAPAGSLVAYSAAPGQTAIDGDGANSPYTSALLEAMREPGVELLQVFRRVRLDVESETQGRQTPWEEQSLRTDFYFAGDAAEPAGQDTAASEPEPPASGGGDVVELAFWNSVKDSRNPVIIQTYLERFPNGIFSRLAQVMIAALSPAETSVLEQEQQAQEAQGEDPDLARHIQSALDEVGCDPGPVDGVWGPRSQRALDRFASHASVSLTGEALSEATLDAVEGFDGRACPVTCGPREEERGGRCVTKTCPDGQVLDQAGECVAREAAAPEPEPPAERTFDNPLVRGLPVDICVSPSSRCRGQAALRYCREQGYRRLVEHTTKIYPETAHITGRTTCTPHGLVVCGGYSVIVCAR